MKNANIVIPSGARNPVLISTGSFVASRLLRMTIVWLLAISFAQPVQATTCCIINNNCDKSNRTYDQCINDQKGFFDPECANPRCTIETGFASDRFTYIINVFGEKLGFTPTVTQNPEPEVVIGKIIQGLLAVIGAIFGVLIIYAGVRWMTARGNEETVKQAIETLQAAVIGFVVVVGAYAITAYVVGKVISAALAP